ncbi:MULTISPECIES: DNA repair protein RecN [unclassified Roseitalea]|uniref:DNA repair protein RecN n=1 Tax=unclassified Roseitalea TaxID=2639107 RepID=UPI00273D48D8|nr:MULTISPECIES: DNA repair protein RecN [unclassified Roseitalea]
MLIELSIRDIVLIEALTIRFDAGLAVLTGETGAGKSILLDAMSLALGGRGDAGLVRHGASQGQVSAVFDLPPGHPLFTALEEAGVAIEPGEPLILRRTQSADGRSRAFVNDQTVGVATLRMAGRQLVEIHGQHDERALVDTASHRQLLDTFGGLGAQVDHVGALHGAWRAARAALKDHRARVEAAAREADFLRAAVEELTELAPEPGEEGALAEARAAMMASEKVAGDLNEALETLAGPSSPLPEIAGLLRRLERKEADAPGLLEQVNEHLGQGLDHLAEAQNLIEQAIASSDHDPHALERTEERLFALRAAARKHHVGVDDLAALAVEMADKLAELDAGEARLAELDAAERAALAAYDRAALALSEARGAVADRLAEAVMAELPALKLEKARFMVNLHADADTRTPSGIDTVAFHVQTNPGTRAGPMMKVASGGELSRFLLALKVALADRGSAPTLVFDEIDTGVGGAVADAIGARLARLSDAVQVLSVTHAPQVAARAAHHYLIAKSGGNGSGGVVTSVTEMDRPARREEIARMLAGATVTEEARAAAARLLEGAG